VYLADLEPTAMNLGGDKKIRYGSSDAKLSRKAPNGAMMPLEKSFLLPWQGETASVSFRLDDKALSFQSMVGYSEEHNDFFGQSTTFEVVGDGQTLW